MSEHDCCQMPSRRQGVLVGGVGGTSPECLSRAAMCLKLIAARAAGAVEAYRPEVTLTLTLTLTLTSNMLIV